MNNTEKIIAERITVQKLGSGWAAVHMILIEDNKHINQRYWDVQQTGIGRFETKEEAIDEAVNWSESDEIILDRNIACPMSPNMEHIINMKATSEVSVGHCNFCRAKLFGNKE